MTRTKGNQVEVEDEELLILSEFCSDLEAQVPEGEKKTRRRRKKAKAEAGAVGFRKRKLNEEQANFLEMNFGCEHKLESARKDRLAAELALDPRQVAVWFQNRRARWKRKQLEEDFARLKTMHEAVIVEKCHLENEALKLRERVSEADQEIRKLTEQSWDRISEGQRSGSPGSGSSFSMDAHQPFLGEFVVENEDGYSYMPDNYYINGVDWLTWYGL